MNEHRSESQMPPRHHGSFRDPSGFVFAKNGVLYRQVNRVYAPVFDYLVESGLYAELVRKGYVVPHEEIRKEDIASDAYKIIRPEKIPFISYPYEWCFSELKDAALLTLKIQKTAIRFGMCLKDASAYNIQFKNGRPILIDTLSFERYQEGVPWVAYRQFCEHFMASLALMSFTDVRLSQLLRTYIDGIPLDLASKLLPWRSWFHTAILFHIHMHAKSDRRHKGEEVKFSRKSVSSSALGNILESLKVGVSALNWNPRTIANLDFEGKKDYPASEAKEEMRELKRFFGIVRPKLAWGFGMSGIPASQSMSELGTEIIEFDNDPTLVEKNYLAVREKKAERLLPLVMDLTNPSPSIGWASGERASLLARGPADLVVALDLIHALAISNNVSFEMVADFFSDICRELIIEFIPRDDARVRRLLKNRADIFGWYNRKNFETAFGRRFTIASSYESPASKLVIYLMRRK